MSDQPPRVNVATRVAYGVTQLPRVAWYVGHSLLVRQLSNQARRREGSARSPARASGPVPDRRRLYADMAALLRRDLANVEAGIYPLPADHDGSLARLIERSRLFFEDLPDIHRRREAGMHQEVWTEDADEPGVIGQRHEEKLGLESLHERPVGQH